MSFLLGLTGSIGMGKSTTARMFVEEGCALWDADAAVHRLYAKGGPAVAAMAGVFPDAILDGAVDRMALKQIIATDTSALSKIEAIVHPLVAADRRAFVENTDADIVVLDIPLLYETGAESQMDAVVCVTASPEEQRRRILERGTMTDAQFNHILSKQMPNTTKCAKSDYVIETDTLDHARARVKAIVADISKRRHHA